MEQFKNYGYIHEERANPNDHELGGLMGLSYPDVQPDGQWFNFLPYGEQQNINGVETNSCVSFAALTGLEILAKKVFDKEVNHSDRYLAIASDTGPNGNTPTKVLETLRAVAGCIPENLLPFSEDILSLEQYMSPKPLNKKYYDEGRRWLAGYDFKHAWVNTDPDSLMHGLKKSPLIISVVAWQEGADGIYIRPPGVNYNHATLLVGYEEGKYWLVFDSYPGTGGAYLKKLDWNFGFGMAKAIKITAIKKEGFIKRLTRWLASWFK